MDPVGAIASIVQILRNAYSIGNYIYKVYEGAKVIDDSIQGLVSEVNNLADSCDLVRSELDSVFARRPHAGTADARDSKDGKLARCINQQVTSCENTLEELWRLVENLWPRKRTLPARALKQIDLQSSKEQIDEFRNRIKSHTSALHTTLLVATIQVAHIAPERATQQLEGKLDDLQRSLLEIESRLDVKHRRKDSTASDGETTLVNFARETLRSGKTLCEASAAGSIYGNDSVLGGHTAAGNNSNVAEWLIRVNSLRRESGHFLAPPTPSVFSDDEEETVASGAAGGTLDGVDEGDGYDSDDEQIDLAKAAWDKGFRAFDAARWEEASKYLHKSLMLLDELPHKHKIEWDIFELQYRLAVCSYHTGSIDQAEAGLESLLQHQPLSNDQGIQLCSARHLLARIFVEQRKLDRATKACKSTLQARTRLLGKEHVCRYESMALMSRIYRLLDDDVTSELYAEMIPETYRDDLLAALSTLKPNHPPSTIDDIPDSSSATTSTLIPPATPVSPKTTGQLAVPSSNSKECDGSLHSLSPDLSPLSLSPQLIATEGGISLQSTSKPTHKAKSQSVDSGAAFKRWPSMTTNSSRDSGILQMKPEPPTGNLPANGLPRSTSVPIVSLSPTRSCAGAPSTSTQAKSTASLGETTEETFVPLRTSTCLGGSAMPPSPMSRPERAAIVARFKIEPMHNLDQAICDGRVERAQVLVNAVLSGSTQLGNAADSIVFKANGLRYANKSPALHLAILFGDVELVKSLIKNGFSPNFAYQISDESGLKQYTTPLDLAIGSRNEEIIRQLLVNGALIDPPRGMSPCRQLLASPSLQFWPPADLSEITCILESILASSWPVGKGFSRQGFPYPAPTLLHQACSLPEHLSAYRLPLVRLLLDQPDATSLSVPATETPLHHAIRLHDPEVVSALLQAQRNFRLRSMLEKRNAQSHQPLYLAIRHATANHNLSLEIVRNLLDHGADLDEVHTHYEARLLRPSKKTHTTARSIAMESGREDLLALVQLHRKKEAPVIQALARSQTASDNWPMLPHIGVLR